MSVASMSIKSFVEVAQRVPVDHSITLRGPHGIGKSQLVRYIARLIEKRDDIKDYEVIDRRLSQMTEGDMIGLPSTEGGVTRFNPPDWFKKACDKPVVLFLDELNRATPEVMQAAFQVVLDRELNGWKLHPQTRVFAAVNNSAEYSVNEMDPALIDRFFVVDLRPTTEDWLTWAKRSKEEYGGGIHPIFVEFIQQNDTWLDPPKAYDVGSKTQSRRSWERYSYAASEAGVADDATNEIFYLLGLGYVGLEASIAFTNFAKSIDNRFTGADILKGYAKVKPKIKRVGAEGLNTAIEKVVDELVKLGKLNKKQQDNLGEFAADLPPELRVVLWKNFAAKAVKNVSLIKDCHVALVKPLLDVFGVKMGAEGVNMVPTIPGILKDKK